MVMPYASGPTWEKVEKAQARAEAHLDLLSKFRRMTTIVHPASLRLLKEACIEELSKCADTFAAHERELMHERGFSEDSLMPMHVKFYNWALAGLELVRG